MAFLLPPSSTRFYSGVGPERLDSRVSSSQTHNGHSHSSGGDGILCRRGRNPRWRRVLGTLKHTSKREPTTDTVSFRDRLIRWYLDRHLPATGVPGFLYAVPKPPSRRTTDEVVKILDAVIAALEEDSPRQSTRSSTFGNPEDLNALFVQPSSTPGSAAFPSSAVRDGPAIEAVQGGSDESHLRRPVPTSSRPLTNEAQPPEIPMAQQPGHSSVDNLSSSLAGSGSLSNDLACHPTCLQPGNPITDTTIHRNAGARDSLKLHVPNLDPEGSSLGSEGVSTGSNPRHSMGMHCLLRSIDEVREGFEHSPEQLNSEHDDVDCSAMPVSFEQGPGSALSLQQSSLPDTSSTSARSPACLPFILESSGDGNQGTFSAPKLQPTDIKASVDAEGVRTASFRDMGIQTASNRLSPRSADIVRHFSASTHRAFFQPKSPESTAQIGRDLLAVVSPDADTGPSSAGRTSAKSPEQQASRRAKGMGIVFSRSVLDDLLTEQAQVEASSRT